MSEAKSLHSHYPEVGILDPQSRKVLDEIAAAQSAPLSELGATLARAAIENIHKTFGLAQVNLVDVENRAIPGPGGALPIRIYRPKNLSVRPTPVLVFYHGGGAIAGTLDGYDAICQHMSLESGIILVSVDYRLAPEHRFPAAVDDAYAALLWVHAHADELGANGQQIAVGGDSMGGYLAAAVTQLARDAAGPPLTFQLLIYPAIGTRGESRSKDLFASGYLSEPGDLDWLYMQYLGDLSLRSDPRVSPIRAADLSRLPPAFTITAGFDILRDDGEHYAALLSKAGVPSKLSRYETTVHPFLSLAGVIDEGKRAISECALELRRAFNLPKSEG